MIIMIRSIILLRRRICTLLRPRWLGNAVDDAYTLWSENQKKGQKSDNLQYNTLGRWVDRLIDQVSDGPSIILID